MGPAMVGLGGRARPPIVALGGAILLGIAIAVPAGAQSGGTDGGGVPPPGTEVPHVAPGEPLPPTPAPPAGPPPAEPGPASAAAAAPVSAAATTPRGTTTLLDSGAWSWFEDERVVIDAAGRRLYASAVEAWPTRGEVVLAEVDLASGGRRNLSLGVAELDDHNSAAIWEAPSREVLTAWSRHSADPIIRTHRRRTNGTWLRLPPVVDSWPFVTYNNLYSVLAADGTPVLYDFYRGARIDPQAMASIDAGRTWSRLGSVLRDPTDSTGQRPYVRYASRGDRIDLIATETHPRNSRTSVYHGFIRDGNLYTSDGRSLGRVGTGVPVTSLTLVGTPGVAEAAWTVDINYDPATGRPIAAYSTTLSPTDHRYHIARWTGSAWDTREVAFAGRGLYAGEYHYTGLVALDPRDGGHVVISTDADPVTGRALVSGTDGRRHWELFDGRRQADGRYAWTPLTANSAQDNIRPVMTAGPGSSSALAWMRGTYTTYSSYSLAVVGVVRRADGSTVTTGAAGRALPVVLGIASPPVSSVAGVLLGGDFDSHPADDLMLYRSGPGREDMVIGDDGGRPVFARARAVNGEGYRPATGDFDADGDDDVLWHGPGSRTDSLWLATPAAGWRPTTAPQVTSSVHRPLTGDFDADGDDDVLWYSANGGETLWRADRGTFTAVAAPQVRSAYRTAVGDIDRDGDDDILWHAPGTAPDYQWLAQDGRFSQQFPLAIDGDAQPLAGDYDGDGDDDVLLYAPGTATDVLLVAEAGAYTARVSPRQAGGTYRPTVLDLDGNRADDILWYRVGGPDYLWSSRAGSPFAASGPSPVAF